MITKHFTIRIQESLREALEAEAKKQRRTRSQIVKFAIEEYIRNHKYDKRGSDDEQEEREK